MSLIPPFAHINTLDDDTLLHIFEMNGNMFLLWDALCITRTTSLVCQRWRNLMLATPSLWARLIDIRLIARPGHYKWRKELMRRTEAALLWIRVDKVNNTGNQPADSSKSVESFFYKMIYKNWHRIQKLVMNVQVPPTSTFHPRSWQTLLLPAPELETFNIKFKWTDAAEHTDNDPLSELFSGSAPMLRDFYILPYTVDEHVPWLCHLRVMKFDSAYGVRLVLGILSSTYYLQELEICALTPEEISSPLPIAPLPHLKYFKYRGRPQEGAILLDHTEIPAKCLLNIHSSRGAFRISSDDTEKEYLSICNTFIRAIQRYLRFHAPKCITLRCSRRLHITTDFNLPAALPFIVSFPLETAYNRSPPWINLTKIVLPELSCVTELHFHSSLFLNPSLRSFFRGFTSVKTIYAHTNTLGFLTVFQSEIETIRKGSFIILPSLHTIDLDIIEDWDEDDGDAYELDFQTKDFIKQRKRKGRPISTLRLVDCLYDARLETFANANGFKVLTN